jgi:hypothetical protein
MVFENQTKSKEAEGLDSAAVLAAGVGTWRWDFAINNFVLSGRATELLGAPSAVLAYSELLLHVDSDQRASLEHSLQRLKQEGRDHDVDFQSAKSKKGRKRSSAIPRRR